MKRKATLLRMPEDLFDAITRQAEKQGRNEMLCGILYEHFKDKIVSTLCKVTPDIPGMAGSYAKIEAEKQINKNPEQEEATLEAQNPQS